MESPVKGGADSSGTDFVWDEYLEVTNSKAAPPTAFTHVEHSLVSSVEIGMKLEVPNPEEKDSYWIASVVMTCGQLLSLRYLGFGDDRSSDFWFDIKAGEFHPIGWCKRNNKTLHPPKSVRERHSNFQALLTSEIEGDTVSVPVLNDPDAGITPIDQIKVDMVVEVSHELNYSQIWPAKVIQNIGGRLLLRYHGSPETGETDFWLFYLSERIHAIGWAEMHDLKYSAPEGKKIEDSQSLYEKFLKFLCEETEGTLFPAHVLEPQIIIDDHEFQEGMKLEVLNPLTLLDVKAATVTRVINSQYFIVDVDNLNAEGRGLCYPSICCYSGTPIIFPCNWAKENNLEIVNPDGYNKDNNNKGFRWEEYLEFCSAIPAPKELFTSAHSSSEFKVGMKLEAVNPFFPDQIHVSTVQNVVGPLMWIRIDSTNSPRPNHATSVNSLDVFPVGWCASNAHPLQTTCYNKGQLKSVLASPQKSSLHISKVGLQKDSSQGKSWCPKIYFNPGCYTGPYLSKSRFAGLPRDVGPGPMNLVMKNVLRNLLNIAYKSSQVLKELQMSGTSSPSMRQETVKAKYRGKSFSATVEFVRKSDQVEDFCRKICRKLCCCPYLFGPKHVGSECPENCAKVPKCHFGNPFLRRNPNDPNSYGSNIPGYLANKKGPGRKRKRKHWRFINNAIIAANKPQDDEEEDESEENLPKTKEKVEPKSESIKEIKEKEEKEPVKKKPKPATITKSVIVTRGAKLPNFGLSWRHEDYSTKCIRRRGRPPLKKPIVTPTVTVTPTAVRKKGRPLGSTKIKMLQRHQQEREQQRKQKELLRTRNRLSRKEESEKKVVPEEPNIKSNPLDWSIDDVVEYVEASPCALLAPVLKEQEIDGQALLMLTLPSVQEFLNLKFEPAKAFCMLIEKIKYQFFTDFT